MNDLQTALIAAGSAAVVVVWAYNRWQERSHRKLAEKVFHGGQPDILMKGQPDEAEPPTERIEPRGDAPEEEKDLPPNFPPLPEEWADDIADCAIRIDFVEAVPAASLWAVQESWSARVSKALSWLGFDDHAGAWRRLTAEDAGRYSVVCATLQLADRQGAVPDSELSVFLDGVRQIARQFSGLAEVPAQDGVLTHARALDEFCAGVDVQLDINVVGADGTLTPFTLDVPRVADGQAVFDRMLAMARQLIEERGGMLADAQRNPLSDDMIAAIRARIGEMQQKMAENRIPAGGARALRLFA
ncbi:MAG: cell division protein ZipA C-terminal FtsZ-binding domain-containing protein [Candidatus Nitricoxidivorans perseverans]|uniref:Cell division protein ZipA n=1 Tax=Candidatus Nitricoxidivorans perseverans TaxID=2975601 RepID=A0AA49J008_9PROT|nr:MAG: cell division protein ZipA C-terminal FtsZ-binding domain-containing protein [Candidatus Nitricoxidivorans perseverans]